MLARQSVAINGIDGIALTKLDVLDGFETLKICVGYRAGGERLDYLPAGLKAQSALRPDLRGDRGLARQRPAARAASATCRPRRSSTSAASRS